MILLRKPGKELREFFWEVENIFRELEIGEDLFSFFGFFLIKHFIWEEHGERKKGKHTIEPSKPTSFTFDTFSKILVKFLGFWCFFFFLSAYAQEGKRKGGQNGTLHQAQKTHNFYFLGKMFFSLRKIFFKVL